MNISLLQVLNAPLFENVKILSGRAGLGRIVKRASVFDAPFKEDVLEKDILAPGDFFITSLLQFQPKSEELMQVLALLVKGNCSGEKYDTGNFRNEENERLEKALLMAFDPYTNEEIMELLKEQFQVDMLSQGQVKEYYRFPVMCLLRIKESIDTWEKHSGSDGYFDFIEVIIPELSEPPVRTLGATIPENESHIFR